MSQLVQSLELDPGAHIVGRPSSGAVRASEELLGIDFPPSYRTFTEHLGAAGILGREVYGVVSDPGAVGPPNVVWTTLNARRSFGLPHRYLIVVEMDDASAYALDSEARRVGDEMPVVRIRPGETGEDLVDREVAPDFASFLAQFLAERREAFDAH